MVSSNGKMMELRPSNILEMERNLFRTMSPRKKIDVLMRLIDTAKLLKTAGLKHSHPTWSDQQIQNEIRELFLYDRI
jgi:hypothetical protein